MDLKLLDAVASPEEREVVAAFAGGGRDQLLPALHAVNDRVGWISQGALHGICDTLHVPPADAYGVAGFYSLFALAERPARVVHVCTDLACRVTGADTVCDVLTEHVGAAGKARGGVTWLRSPCLGVCERAPAALTFQAGDPATTELIAPATGASAVLAAQREPPLRRVPRQCVDACGDQWQNSFAISVAGRGFDARISTEFSNPLPDSARVYCGNCAEVCPTGALSFKREYDKREDGTWDESRQRRTTTVCTFCGVGCTLTLHVQNR